MRSVMQTLRRFYAAAVPRGDFVIAFFCLALLAGVWMLTLERIGFERGEAVADAMRQNDNLALALEEHVTRTIKSVDQVVLFVRQQYQQRGMKLDIRQLIDEGAIDAGILTFVGVINERGDLVLGDRDFSPVNLADREHFQVHQRGDSRDIFISKPVLGRVSQLWSIQITRRINKPDGSFGGVAIAGVDVNYFTKFYRQADLGEQGLITLVGLDGITRARRIGPLASFGQDMHRSTLFSEQAKRPIGHFRSAGALDGVPRYLSFRRLPQYPLIVAVATSEQETLAAFGQRERAYYLGAALASIIATILSGGLIATLSRQRRALRALTRREAQYRATFNQAGVGIGHAALDGRILRANQKLCDMLGYGQTALTNLRVQDIAYPEDLPALLDDRKKLATGEIKTSTRELRLMRNDGALCWVNRGLSLVCDETGEPQYFIAVLEDITDRKALEEGLLRQAQYDNLTQLPNRVLCYDRLKQALSHARRRQWIVGVLFIDLDRFKSVNDTFGHIAGDQLLQQVSERLASCVRSDDTIGRLSGDEFAVILAELEKAQDSGSIAQKIIDAMVKPFWLDAHEVFVTASVGIANYPDDGQDADSLIRNADAAMFRAKGRGRNSYQFYTAAMNEQALENLLLETELRRALDRREFVLHFQPKISFANGRITGCEALLRWNPADRGMVAPSQFVPVLESSGMIVAVGEWVIDTACAQIRAWQQAGVAAVPIAVNLSAAQFHHHDICAVVTRALSKYAIEPRLLELEITESAAMQNAEDTAVMLRKLKALGVSIVIDDFGTGYSSLSYLKRFSIDTLKLDRSFVVNLPHDPDNAAISRAVITMAHSLNLKVVAEGVETDAQLAFLASYSCDEMQGYHFSQALTAFDCTQLLRQQSESQTPDRSGEHAGSDLRKTA